ncbi:MAG: bifunctional glutamate N-acetyltransferase/amino-acid acetyltransferase ArgJ [Verrucomicrobia bacterium]|nr:bifunctional glutamate N-acetyltransferase/amino-acid acetyltransferase ArgJ [Verrucomicrobiota bacterium]
MKGSLQQISGSITAPKGFLASGVFCDIKRLGTGKGSNKGKKRDLALIVSEVPATVAGLFTTNQVCAAPVKVCLEHVKQGTAQAIVVNSGNANACTGKQGLKDAQEMARLTAQAVAANVCSRSLRSSDGKRPRSHERRGAIPVAHVFVASTGRIGVTLPMANVKRGIEAAAKVLGASGESGCHVAEAIMTSDTRPKQIAVEFPLGGHSARIAGVCKGAGMIQPGMSATGERPAAVPLHATMLCFITTDAAIEPKALQLALNEAVANSFNRITVDGDMSTNDTVLVLANGLAGNPRIAAADMRRLISESPQSAIRSPQLRSPACFQSALNHVCLELAKMIVRDGEGVSRFVTVRVNGAKSFAEAAAAARAVANSALVKTSWNGGDPNWGRIIDALGYSAATVVEDKVDIAYSAPGSRKLIYSLERGQPTRTPFKALCAAVAAKEFDLHIHLNLGPSSAVIYAADLTEAYVDFNKGDVSDPAALGG